MYLSKEDTKELSLQKWEYIVGNDGSDHGLLYAVPDLKHMRNECSYCEVFRDNECEGCPVNVGRDSKFSGCGQKFHPFMIWHNDRNRQNAELMFNLIKKIT